MTRSLLPFALVSLLATGCAHATLTAPTAPKEETAAKDATAKDDEAKDATKDATAKDDAAKDAKDDATKEATKDATAKDDAAKGDAAKDDARHDLGAIATKGRSVGDFIVYRFSGSFRKTPLTLTERVIARKGSILTVDLTADEDGKKQELRLSIDEGTGGKNDVVAVARLVGGVEKPGTIAEYEALMATTALAADENEALLGKEELTLDLGGAPLPVRKTIYRVRVGKKHATLHTLESDGFAWGDVGGEITTTAGKTLYKAQILELGHTDAGKGRAVAEATP